MDEQIVIKVENLSKKFTTSIRRSMLYGTMDMFRDMLGISYDSSQLRKGEFWALKDISFELKKKESLGIVGINGSGKSTLLRLIAGIFPIDQGKVSIRGKIGSLIAVGAGFHPHMSGRENVYLNGTILGMTRKEIDQKFDDIVNFADIGEFLDAPISTYSSGMRVRLGFAIAIHCEPEILLIDEILSVGDISFRNKSLRRMAEYRENANALIFISHDIEQVRILCNRLIILDKGRMIYDGPTHQGIVMYEELTRDIRLDNVNKEGEVGNYFSSDKIRRGLDDGETVEVMDLGILNEQGERIESVGVNKPITLYCDFELKKDIEKLSFYLSLRRDDTDKDSILLVSNDNGKQNYENLSSGKYRVSMHIKEPHLAPGIYNPNIAFRNDKTFETYRKIYSKLAFKVASDGEMLERGMVAVQEEWDLKKID